MLRVREGATLVLGAVIAALAITASSGGARETAHNAPSVRAGSAKLDCGRTKAGSKQALIAFTRILRRGDRDEIESVLAEPGRFEWISVNDARGPNLSVRDDRERAARAVARRGGLPIRITEFQNAERPRPTTDLGFFGTWEGTRHLNGKAALDCVAGTARVLSVGVPP